MLDKYDSRVKDASVVKGKFYSLQLNFPYLLAFFSGQILYFPHISKLFGERLA